MTVIVGVLVVSWLLVLSGTVIDMRRSRRRVPPRVGGPTTLGGDVRVRRLSTPHRDREPIR